MNIVFNDTLGELVLYDFYKTKKKGKHTSKQEKMLNILVPL